MIRCDEIRDKIIEEMKWNASLDTYYRPHQHNSRSSSTHTSEGESEIFIGTLNSYLERYIFFGFRLVYGGRLGIVGQRGMS